MLRAGLDRVLRAKGREVLRFPSSGQSDRVCVVVAQYGTRQHQGHQIRIDVKTIPSLTKVFRFSANCAPRLSLQGPYDNTNRIALLQVFHAVVGLVRHASKSGH